MLDIDKKILMSQVNNVYIYKLIYLKNFKSKFLLIFWNTNSLFFQSGSCNFSNYIITL